MFFTNLYSRIYCVKNHFHTLYLLKLNIVFVNSEEDGFLRSVILDVNSSGTQFKLAPTYTSYMAVRYCISGGYRPDMSPHDRAHRVTGLVKKISHLVHQAVQVCGIILV